MKDYEWKFAFLNGIGLYKCVLCDKHFIGVDDSIID